MKRWKKQKNINPKDILVAAERDGVVCDFADFGNSPFNFVPGKIRDKTIVYSTTNGTQAINKARNCYKVAIGAFLNLEAIANWLIYENHNVVILCAGWKNRFSLEDTIFAGALAQKLLDSELFETICDSSLAACDLWSLAEDDLIGYIQKAAHRTRLKKLGFDDVIEYCHTLNNTDIVPVLSDNILVKKNYCEKNNNFF